MTAWISPMPRSLGRRDAWALIGIFAFAVSLPTLIGALAGSLDIARNDDGIYRRLAIHLFTTGSFDLNGVGIASLIGQLLTAQPFLWLSGGQSWALWVVGVLFDAIAMVAGFLMVRRLLPTGRAAFAILLVPLFPGFLPYAPSFMTDVPGLAAEFACLALGMLAVARRPISLPLLAASLTVGLFGFSIREFALTAPAGVVIMAILAEPRRIRIWLSGLGFASLCWAFHIWRAAVPGQLTYDLIPISADSIDRVLRAASSTAFVLLPAAILSWPRCWRRVHVLDVGLGVVLGLLLAGGRIGDFISTGKMPSVLLDNLMSKWGTTEEVMLHGGRPQLIPDPLWDALNGLALIATFLVLATATGMVGALLRGGSASRMLAAARNGSPAWMLALFAGMMAAGLAAFGLVAAIYDRYLWALIPPLAALLLAFGENEDVVAITAPVGRVTRRLGPMAAAAGAALLALVLGTVGVVFLLNSDSFDGARWRGGDVLVATGVRPETVDAGIEWLGYHAPGIAQWGPPDPNRIWYQWLWPDFRMCGVVASQPQNFPGAELVMADPHAYRLLLFSGPEQPLYIYKVPGAACS